MILRDRAAASRNPKSGKQKRRHGRPVGKETPAFSLRSEKHSGSLTVFLTLDGNLDLKTAKANAGLPRHRLQRSIDVEEGAHKAPLPVSMAD
jgi:hypothetical protein